MNLAKAEAAYERALRIRYDHNNGLWLPVIEQLSCRGFPDAMRDLACWMSDTGERRSAFLLYRRAYKAGARFAAEHLAMDCFNRDDLIGYRAWLHRAARTGDGGAAVELRRFEMRLPHRSARQIGRLRPYRRSE